MADKTYKILIVHPNIDETVGMREILESEPDRDYEFEIASSEDETIMHIMQSLPILVIIRYDERNLSTSKIIKTLNNLPISSRPGVLAFGPSINIRIMRQLSVLGSLDYINEPISAITLRIKVKNAIGTVEFNREQNASKSRKQETQDKDLTAQEISDIKENRKASAENARPEFKIDIEKVEAQTRRFSNINWEVNEDQCKSTKGNWVFLADGPAPDMGKWDNIEKGKWQWKWNDSVQSETDELPDFFFEGIEPIWTKGNWENGKWVMAGKKPSLSLKSKKGETPKSIINFENNKPEISEDIDFILPDGILEDLAKTFLVEGEARVLGILRNCHYSNEKMLKIIPLIKQRALEIDIKSGDKADTEMPAGKWIHIGKS
ncbi:MAG: hypothetical protein JXA66_03560, partial [Oligoflexia bacterium]|nr:hypothetical protein [Oligoflexia bacterium]